MHVWFDVGHACKACMCSMHMKENTCRCSSSSDRHACMYSMHMKKAFVVAPHLHTGLVKIFYYSAYNKRKCCISIPSNKIVIYIIINRNHMIIVYEDNIFGRICRGHVHFKRGRLDYIFTMGLAPYGSEGYMKPRGLLQ